MGMNFSPMYQPVSTKTIKADGDLNINPYDLLATDVKCDTVEADEFVGGVGNFQNVILGINTTGGLFSSTLSGNTVSLSETATSGRLTIQASNFSLSTMKTNVSISVYNGTTVTDTFVITVAGIQYSFTVDGKATSTKNIELPVGTYNCSTDESFYRHSVTITTESKTYYAGITVG